MVELILQGFQHHILHRSAEQSAQLKSDESLAGAPLVEQHIEVGLGPDQDRLRLTVNRQDVVNVFPFELLEDVR